MGKIDYFDIQLESSSPGVFLAGQRINGNVIMKANGTVKVAGPLQLTLIGETRTFWVNKTSDKIYESFQPHLNVQFDLKQPGDDEIGEGVHTVPFSLDLPLNLLSTFEADFGATRYTCAAKMRLHEVSCFNPMSGSTGPEVICDKSVSVLALVARAMPQEVDAPIKQIEETDVYGLLGRKKGTIVAELALPHRNFRLGEAINIAVTINNQSSQKIKSVDILLLQHCRFEALSRYEAVSDVKEINRAVECATMGEVSSKSAQQFKLSMPVKTIPPSQNTGLINISYFLKLDCQPGNEIIVPIAIYTMA